MVLYLRFLIGTIALLTWGVAPAVGQNTSSESAASFFPATTAAILHIEEPAALISKIENHELLDHALKLEPVEKLLNSPQGTLIKLGQGLLETQLGESVWQALKTNTSKGLWVGFDPAQRGVVMAFQSADETRLKRVAGTVLKMVAQQAEREGKEIPYEKRTYRDAVAAEFDGFLIARYQDWFLVANQPKLAKQVVDNLMDGNDESLATQAWYQTATQEKSQSDVWGAVNLERVRQIAKNKSPFEGKTDNPGVELVFGGILDVLQHSPVAEVKFDLTENLDLSLSAPFQQDWANEFRAFFFGKSLKGFAPTRLAPKNLIASLTSYRDIGQWWLSKEDLYPENVIAQLAQADSQLSTIFSGMDFGEDVLGALQPGVQLLVTENQYDSEYVPDLKLPAFALVGKLKDVKSIQRKLRIAFQSVIGFANINLGMNGQPQLEVETEKLGDVRISSASYFYEEGTEEGLILFNFAPTIAFKGNHLIVASTRALAVELGQLVQDDLGTEKANTALQVNGEMLHRILEANKESLIAQNMLEEGNDRREAESAIGILLLIADLFKDANLNYQVRPNEMKLDVQVGFDLPVNQGEGE